MDTSTMILLAAVIIGGVVILYVFSYFRDKKTLSGSDGKGVKQSVPLQLQAYERLVLLTGRIALPNLVSRTDPTGLSAGEMQMMLVQTIKQEFEHNITQQIYVTAEAWEAIRNLKEQNILIINQIASFLPGSASGSDLGKSIMELLIENPKASLHNIVSDALSYEAKKLL